MLSYPVVGWSQLQNLVLSFLVLSGQGHGQLTCRTEAVAQDDKDYTPEEIRFENETAMLGESVK